MLNNGICEVLGHYHLCYGFSMRLENMNTKQDRKKHTNNRHFFLSFLYVCHLQFQHTSATIAACWARQPPDSAPLRLVALRALGAYRYINKYCFLLASSPLSRVVCVLDRFDSATDRHSRYGDYAHIVALRNMRS